MEWVLQVVDEIDDAIAALRHVWLGQRAHIGTLGQALSATTTAALAASLKFRIPLTRPTR